MKQRCQYNMCCEDYAEDGNWKSWDYAVPNNGPAKHHIEFVEDGQVFEYDLCDGCKAGLESTLENDDKYEILEIRRIAPQTKTYKGKTGLNRQKNATVIII